MATSRSKLKPKFNDTFLDRVYYSTIGFHKFRFLLGCILNAFFLALLFVNPLLLPVYLAPAAFWFQTNLLPFIAALGLGIYAQATVATIGSFLTLTAPKWIGNILQFVGKRLIGGVIHRITMIPATLVGKKPDANKITFSDVIFFALPVITSLAGELLNKLGMLLAGEYLYSALEEKKAIRKPPENRNVSKSLELYETQVKQLSSTLSPEEKSKEEDNLVVNLLLGDEEELAYLEKNRAASPFFAENSADSVQMDSALIMSPSFRYTLAKDYLKFMDWLAEKSPVPSLKEAMQDKPRKLGR